MEVFRGPQTTTQGPNSIAGTIFVDTNDPTYEQEIRARGLLGNFNTQQASATLSGPFIRDRLAYRVSVNTSKQETFVEPKGVTEQIGRI